MWEEGEAKRAGPCWVLRVVHCVVFCAHSLPIWAGEEGNAQDSVSTEVPPGDEQREGLGILDLEAAEPTAQATPGSCCCSGMGRAVLLVGKRYPPPSSPGPPDQALLIASNQSSSLHFVPRETSGKQTCVQVLSWESRNHGLSFPFFLFLVPKLFTSKRCANMCLVIIFKARRQ